MKIIVLSASPRKKATHYVAEAALAAIQERYPDAETVHVSLRGKTVAPCVGCDYCKKNKTWCILKDDGNDLVRELITADGLLLVSPVYVMEPTPQLMALFSRMRPVHHVFPDSFRRTMGASVAVGGTRNGGQEICVNTLNNMLLTRGVNVVPNEVFGYHGGKVWSRDAGARGAEEDEIGMKTVIDLALRLAEMTQLVSGQEKRRK